MLQYDCRALAQKFQRFDQRGCRALGGHARRERGERLRDLVRGVVLIGQGLSHCDAEG